MNRAWLLGTIGTSLRDRVRLGSHGERLAARHLRRRGYRILARNLRVRGGELDLVCGDDSTLIFVEVRTVRSVGGPERAVDAVTPGKAKQVLRAVRSWLASPKGRLALDLDIRIDVVGVDLRTRQIQHLEDAIRLDAVFR